MEQGAILSAGPAGRAALTRELLLARLSAAVPGRRRAPGAAGPTAQPASADLPADCRGDHDLNPDMLPERPLVPAGVLVPLIERPAGFTVLLTQRTAHLHDHAGQICFPGGRLDPGDRDAIAAALRETEEEIGLSPRRVALIGRLDTYVTRTGYEVTPVVGLVDPPDAFAPDPFEVAEVFEMPLAFVLDPANHQRHSRDYGGVRRHFYVLPWQDRYIWGATAGMLVNLAEVLRPAP